MTRIKNQLTVNDYVKNLSPQGKARLVDLISLRVPYFVIKSELGLPGSWQNIRYFFTSVDSDNDIKDALVKRDSQSIHQKKTK